MSGVMTGQCAAEIRAFFEVLISAKNYIHTLYVSKKKKLYI